MQDKQTHTFGQEAQPLVTFIVTCYNLPPSMLCECIDSLLALSLDASEREIIVVDDGSEKSPMDQLMRYGDSIIYLRKTNGGVSTARNMGLRTATGRYIQFVDGDDRLIKPTYEHCLSLVRKGQADVVMFDFTHEPTAETAHEDWPMMSGCQLMRHHNIQGAACLYLFRRTIVGNLSYTPGINYGEDEEFTPQLLLRADAVVRTTAQAYFYREHESSATGNKSAEGIQRRLDDNRRVISSLASKSATLPTDERIALERRTAQLTMDYLYNTIVLTRSNDQLSQRLDSLRKEGLFPLPARDYTAKYKWFRLMSGSALGRALLMKALPMMKKER